MSQQQAAAANAQHDWIDICALDDIAVLGARQLQQGSLKIALIRTTSSQVYAIEDRCPHRGGPLSEGLVSADRVSCPLHGQCVELATGRMVAPDEGQTRCFNVQVQDGRVQLQRAALLAALNAGDVTHQQAACADAACAVHTQR